jgi:hypothetical protein
LKKPNLKGLDVKKLKSLDVKNLDVKTVRLGMLGLLVVAGVAIGAIALIGGGSGSDSSAGGSSGEEAVALSESELLAQAGGLGGPAYWIGPRAGTTSYELTTTADGRIYIRYLTGGAEAGDPEAEFLTIGTYPVPEAQAALRKAAKSGGGTLTQGEGFEVLTSKEGTDAYVVFDDQPGLQVEVFSPQAGEAEQLATSGSVKPLG